MLHRRKRPLALAVVGGAALLAAAGLAWSATTVKPYVVALGGDYELTPLLSVGDRVPEASDSSLEYQMVGLPDGLGAYANGDGTTTLLMNHELGFDKTAEPVVGGPAYRGAFVSKYVLDADGDPVSGERAYDTVYVEDDPVGPAPEAGNTTPAFGRFCSGSLAGRAEGFDTPVYFTNEESDSPETFDGEGGLTVAIYDNELHALPGMGRFSKENTVVQPNATARTVVFTLEDGPSTPDSQLYMYVGEKRRESGVASVLERNGLVGGTLYVFRSVATGKDDEASFRGGAITGEWVPIPGAGTMTDAQLEEASDRLGAFGFVRIEDGAFNPRNPNEFFFVTTGGNAAAGNELGRLYSIHLNPVDPRRNARLAVAYNADEIVAAGGDTALSPDNIDASDDALMIQEDGTAQSRRVMAAKGRDGSIWRFPLSHPLGGVNVASSARVVELDPPGRDGVPVGPGVWETSGIINASRFFGEDAWLADVQAHRPTTAPAPGTVEDGQLFLLRPAD